LLLDEQTAQVDLHSKKMITRIPNGVKKKGKSTFFIAHDLNLAPYSANKLIIMDENKRVVSEGTAKSIWKDT